SCVFDERCTGVFSAYAERFGTDELRPVTAERLAATPGSDRLVSLRLRPWLRGALDAAPWVSEIAVEEMSLRETALTLRASDGRALRLLFGDSRLEAVAASDWCTVRVEDRTVDADAALAALRELWRRMEGAGMRTVTPPGADAFSPLHAAVVRRLRRLREAAPFGALAWTETRVSGDGRRVEIALRAPGGDTATVWLSTETGRSSGGYDAGTATPSAAVVDGLRAVLDAVRPE
ncbi:MAG: hypothetical protein ACRELB_25030, partial [Polyangiaceae bacterium]